MHTHLALAPDSKQNDKQLQTQHNTAEPYRHPLCSSIKYPTTNHTDMHYQPQPLQTTITNHTHTHYILHPIQTIKVQPHPSQSSRALPTMPITCCMIMRNMPGCTALMLAAAVVAPTLYTNRDRNTTKPCRNFGVRVDCTSAHTQREKR